jgi:hypothetical protein
MKNGQTVNQRLLSILTNLILIHISRNYYESGELELETK